MKRKIRAVDFDGTLCENKWPEIGDPNLELIEYLIKCKKKGDALILWTCRSGNALTEANWWCHGYGLYFDAVNENLPEVLEWMGGDSRKIYADEYIDDRAYRRTDIPFVSKKITDETIVKLEEVFGFKFHDWQIGYLKGNDDVQTGGRGSGRTFIYCLRLLLSNRPTFDFRDWGTLDMLVDQLPTPRYIRWFREYISDLNFQLQLAGFKTNYKPKSSI